MNKKNNKKFVLSKVRIVSITYLIVMYAVIIMTSTYAYKEFSSEREGLTGQGGCFNVDYFGREITSLNILTSENYKNGAKTSVVLSKNSSCKLYSLANIYLHTNNSTTAPISTITALKYKVLDGETIIAEGTVTEKNSDKLLKTVPLTENPTNYYIYLYIDSELSEGNYNDTTYSGYIYAEANQTSTIENYLVRDISYNANNAMSYGSAIDYNEGTLTTDGIDDYVNIGLENYDFGNSISMVVRAKLNTVPATKNTMIIGNWESGGGGIYLSANSSNPTAQLYLSGYKTITSNTSITAGTWYNYVYTYNGSKQSLYLNGTEVATSNPTGIINAINIPFHLGSNPTTGGNPTVYSNVTYSDVLIFDRALTADEILSTYSDSSKKIAESKVDKTKLLAYYNFKDQSNNSSSNTDATDALTTLKNKASSASDGVYYFDSNGNLDYGNGTKINLSLATDIPKGVVSYSNHTLIYACMNYGSNNYEYNIKTNTLTNRTMRCITDRYQNLVINGDLSYGSNLNLSSFGTYNSEGYLSSTSSTSSSIAATDYIPIDTTKKYVVSVDIKSSEPNAVYYIGFYEYDVSKNQISASNVMYLNNTLTTLSQDLKNGDTVVHLTSLANWNVNTSTKTYQRGFIFWNYKDATNYTYQQLTYSRNVKSNLYSDENVNKTDNTITLTSAWNNGTYPAGTKVSQSSSGSTFNYSVLSNAKITNNFTNYSSSNITGVNTGPSVVNNKFRAGTKFVRFGAIYNNSKIASTTTYIKNISITEVE